MEKYFGYFFSDFMIVSTYNSKTTSANAGRSSLTAFLQTSLTACLSCRVRPVVVESGDEDAMRMEYFTLIQKSLLRC